MEHEEYTKTEKKQYNNDYNNEYDEIPLYTKPKKPFLSDFTIRRIERSRNNGKSITLHVDATYQGDISGSPVYKFRVMEDDTQIATGVVNVFTLYRISTETGCTPPPQVQDCMDIILQKKDESEHHEYQRMRPTQLEMVDKGENEDQDKTINKKSKDEDDDCLICRLCYKLWY